MRIALFGGSFDPPHRGHLAVADAIVERKLADVVWFVPCGDHAFAKEMSPASVRVAMLAALGRHAICRYEIEKQTKSYSVETLEHFQAAQPNDSFFWVIGSDQLPSFPLWHRYQDFLKRCPIFVYPRVGFPMTPLLEGMQPLHGVPEVDVSSTQVRAAVEADQPISSFTTPEVAAIIEAQQLYRQ